MTSHEHTKPPGAYNFPFHAAPLLIAIYDNLSSYLVITMALSLRVFYQAQRKKLKEIEGSLISLNKLILILRCSFQFVVKQLL